MTIIKVTPVRVFEGMCMVSNYVMRSELTTEKELAICHEAFMKLYAKCNHLPSNHCVFELNNGMFLGYSDNHLYLSTEWHSLEQRYWVTELPNAPELRFYLN